MGTRRFVPARVALALSLVLLAPLAAHAQERDRPRGSVLLGAFVTNRDTDGRLDSNNGDGTDIDFEDDLGLQSSLSVARLGGYYWFGERGRVDFSVFDLSRDATHQIDETIEFGDQVYQVNTVINTTNDLTIYKIDYTHAFVSKPRGYFGLGGGLYVARTGMSIDAARLGQHESDSLTAPLPVIGVSGEYDINDRITLRGSTQYFGIDTGTVSGHLTDFYVGADYRFTKRVGVGLAYDRVTLGVEADEDSFDGRLDWGYDGFLLYFKFDFGL
jgi:hypothetical protein